MQDSSILFSIFYILSLKKVENIHASLANHTVYIFRFPW